MGTLRIPLSRGKFALIDEEDASIISGRRWHAFKMGATWYARSSDGAYLHRLIAKPSDGMVVDHINHDGLDNRRKNLRVCTRSQNQRNQSGPQRGNRFIGVTRDRRPGRKPWVAQIGIMGKTVHCGSFYTEEEAARARDAAAIREYGEFATLNFPSEGN